MTGSGAPGGAWSDERLGAAYRARFGAPAAEGLVAETVAAVRGGRAPRLRASTMPRLGWLGIAAVVAVVAVGTGFALRFGLYPGGGTVTEGPPGLKTFTFRGIAFDFPEDWAIHDALTLFSGGSVTAVVGTLPVDPACGLVHIDINCYYEQRLEPGTISIVVGTGAYRGGTIFDAERALPPTVRTTIAGMPALFTDRGRVEGSYYLSDVELAWEIAYPSTPTNVYRIDVAIRGPGVVEYRRQAEALVASFRFTNPPPTIAPDAATARAVGRAAIDEAKAGDRTMWQIDPDVPSWYSCFGDEPDTSSDGFVATSPGGHLDPPVFAVCRWTVAPLGTSFWRLDLRTEWSIGERRGSLLETRWLAADGTAAAVTFEGDFPLTTDVDRTPEPRVTPPSVMVPPGDPILLVPLIDPLGHDVSVEIADASGLLVAARSAALDDPFPGGPDPGPNRASVSNPRGRPNELRVIWSGSPCDATWSLNVELGARLLTIAHPPRRACDAMGVGRDLILVFSEAIPAAEVTAEIGEVIVIRN